MLSERAIKKLEPKEKAYYVSDSRNLTIVVYPSGKKIWKYRRQGANAVKISIGTYPELSLFEARKQRDKLELYNKNKLKRGLAKYLPTFYDLAEEWYRKKCEPATTPKNCQKQRSRLSRLVYPAIGDKPIADITPQTVLSIVEPIEDDGHIDLAHDVCQLIGMILRFGVAIGKAERDVTADLKGALTPVIHTHRATLKRIEEIAGLVKSIEVAPESLVKNAILLNIYTFCRPCEIRNAEWKEIDLLENLWKIPAEKMKRRRPHIVPLSHQALQIIKNVHRYATGSVYLFPSARTKLRTMSDVAGLAFIRRLGYEKGQLTLHGLRSIASTILNENGWPVDAIERQLSHVEGNSVRAAYNYAQFLNIRIPMMQWYADYLDALRDDKPAPKKSDYINSEELWN